MEEISNRCREIEARVKALMDKKKQQKEQVNPNLPNIKQHYVKYNYQRPSSRERELSRNKSIELARKDDSVGQNQPPIKRSYERPSSRERLASLERKNSKDSAKGRYGARYGL